MTSESIWYICAGSYIQYIVKDLVNTQYFLVNSSDSGTDIFGSTPQLGCCQIEELVAQAGKTFSRGRQ